MSYTKIGWQDEPSTTTPINAINLNHMDDEIKASSDKVDLILGNLASEYSTSKTYAVGDYCIYDSKLYKCTTAIATSEAWTPSHWTVTDCGSEISDLENVIGSFIIRKTITFTATNIASKASTQTTFTIPTGYTPFSAKVNNCLWWQVSLSYNGYVFLVNTDGVTKNETMAIDVFFVKTSLVKTV